MTEPDIRDLAWVFAAGTDPCGPTLRISTVLRSNRPLGLGGRCRKTSSLQRRERLDERVRSDSRREALWPGRCNAPQCFSAVHDQPAFDDDHRDARLLDEAALVTPAREVLRQLDADLPMYDVRSMSERMERSLWIWRAYSWLFAAFAGVAILLASAGIYGVISFAVSQHTREIGIRIALGARPGRVMAGVLRNGMLLVGIGVMLGMIAARLTTHFLESLLFSVSTHDTVIWQLSPGLRVSAC